MKLHKISEKKVKRNFTASSVSPSNLTTYDICISSRVFSEIAKITCCFFFFLGEFRKYSVDQILVQIEYYKSTILVIMCNKLVSYKDLSKVYKKLVRTDKFP